MTTQPTPEPWNLYEGETTLFIGGHGEDVIAEVDYRLEEDAAYIVKAVNSHKELLQAIYETMTYLMAQARRDPQEREIVQQLREAWTKAK